MTSDFSSSVKINELRFTLLLIMSKENKVLKMWYFRNHYDFRQMYKAEGNLMDKCIYYR